VVRRLTAPLDDLDVSLFVRGKLGKQACKHILGNQTGATASYKNPIPLEQTQGKRL